MKIIDKFNAAKYSNNFDIIRFIAATLVLYSHCYPLFGLKYEPLGRISGYASFGDLAVSIFFVISGFLITHSYVNTKSVIFYLVKRALRIYPALIVVVVLTVFALGPWCTTLSARDYFSRPETSLYLNNIFLKQIYFTLPGVFVDNAFASSVNGSLWTLPLEMAMYVMIAVFGFLGFFKKRQIICFVPLLFLYCFIDVYASPQKVFLYLAGSQFFQNGLYFVMGMAIYIWRDKIEYSFTLFLGCLCLYFLGFGQPIGRLVSVATLPYMIIYLSLIKCRLNLWSKLGDFSYGFYLYAFPIQQTIYHLKITTNFTYYFALSFATTTVFSVLSWFLVERPALKLKYLRFPNALSPKAIVQLWRSHRANTPS